MQLSLRGSSKPEKSNRESKEETKDLVMSPSSIEKASKYWVEEKITKPFPFLYRETVPFPRKICGRQLPFRAVALTLLTVSTMVGIILVSSAIQFDIETDPVRDFLENGVTEYVGARGLAFYIFTLLAWSSITGYLLLRTGNLDLFGFFHLLAPPALGVITMALFARDINSIRFDGPKSNAEMYYTLAIFIPLATLACGYFSYFVVSKHIEPDVLLDTLSWGYFSATPITILKFGFSGVMEEIGWSGVLFPQLLHATDSYIAASIVGGVIWGLWHVPLIIGGGYNNNISPYWAALMLPWMLIAWAFFHVWLRVRSFSIWPVVVGHMAHNVWIELILDPLVGRSEYLGVSHLARKKHAFYFVGEFGSLATICYIITAALFIIDMDTDFMLS
mmetsp:Transcript_16299/g.24565  ORF Transcript_16299/g.24565 Transcript_16299/m.24565 type:complete len:390 (+) Transcript_16299:40-1209(+)